MSRVRSVSSESPQRSLSSPRVLRELSRIAPLGLGVIVLVVVLLVRAIGTAGQRGDEVVGAEHGAPGTTRGVGTHKTQSTTTAILMAT